MAKRQWLVLLGTLALGILLHFLYEWLPNPVVAVFSAVGESLWEHVKLVFWPLVAAGYVMTGREGRALRPVWQLSAVVCSLFMLGVGYVYHILLGGEWLVFDLALYAGSVLLGFLLPRCFWKITERPALGRAARLLCLVMAVLIAWFTFSPPRGVLFADLSGAVRTFLTIPV